MEQQLFKIVNMIQKMLEDITVFFPIKDEKSDASSVFATIGASTPARASSASALWSGKT